jgi:predicted transcriptional regulator
VKRNNLDICADILKVSRGGARKTHLVYKANLNFKIVKRYLGQLLDSELIENNGDLYYLTEKGSRFIERYDSLVGPKPSSGIGEGIWI